MDILQKIGPTVTITPAEGEKKRRRSFLHLHIPEPQSTTGTSSTPASPVADGLFGSYLHLPTISLTPSPDGGRKFSFSLRRNSQTVSEASVLTSTTSNGTCSDHLGSTITTFGRIICFSLICMKLFANNSLCRALNAEQKTPEGLS